MIPLSVLDLVPVLRGGTVGDALARSLDLAQHVERFGYRRFWVAEHHNMTGIASAATSVVLAHIAGGTSTIRVGAGGIMLPNHSPLVIAEQFGTLAALHPDRIDLGLGRAPGSDQRAMRALRRGPEASDDFPRDVQELQALLGPVRPGQAVQAVPGGGSEVPIWILGSSTFGAQLAAALGLPYAFASHFAPRDLPDALAAYRTQFQPSKQLAKPRAMVGVNVFAAETDEEARRLFTSAQQQFTDLVRGSPGPLRPPIDDIDKYWLPAEKARASAMLEFAIIGSPATVRSGLERVVRKTNADELILVAAIHDHAARVRSYEIAADAVRSSKVLAAAARGTAD